MSRVFSSRHLRRSSLVLAVMFLFLSAFAFNGVNGAADDHHGHHDEEPPIDHLYEVFDKGKDHSLNSTELGELFEALQKGSTPEAADAHAGHAHAGHGHGSAPAAKKEVLKISEILKDYAKKNTQSLNETEFTKACPAMIKCASEKTCEFEHEEHAAAAKKKSTAHANFKIACIVIIFFEALIGGLLPLFIKDVIKVETIMSFLNSFSGGVFLTAGLTHILPHVVETSYDVDHGSYPLPYALVIVGYSFIFLVEKVVFHSHGHVEDHDHDHEHEHEHEKHGSTGMIKSITILVAISCHAILAGISLGMQTERSNVSTLLVAIASHKAPAAFSIGSKFIRSGISRMQAILLICIFAIVTPVGIGIGIGSGSSDALTQLILEGLAAGSFIYIGATEVSTDEFETTVKACEDKLCQGERKDVEGAHVHRVHGAPGFTSRMMAFTAYATGCAVILLSDLAPHVDH